MNNKHHTVNRTEPIRSLHVGDGVIELLPASGYCVRYTSDKPVLGMSFDRQSGTHAIASDHHSDFVAPANTWAYVPVGCDVFSESPSGGEYLKIVLPEQYLMDLSTIDATRRAMSRSLITSARYLRRCVLINHSPDPLLLSGVLDSVLSDVCNSASFDRSFDRSNEGGLAARFTNDEMRLLDDYICSNLDQILSVQVLADQLGLSAGYFSRVFTASVGVSPFDHVIQQRLKRARRLIRRQDDLTTIAHAVGFSSHSHMSMAFRKYLGVPPSAFKN